MPVPSASAATAPTMTTDCLIEKRFMRVSLSFCATGCRPRWAAPLTVLSLRGAAGASRTRLYSASANSVTLVGVGERAPVSSDEVGERGKRGKLLRSRLVGTQASERGVEV